jgi:hypothetical protein
VWERRGYVFRFSVGKPEEIVPLGMSMHTNTGDIKMNLKYTGWEM